MGKCEFNNDKCNEIIIFWLISHLPHQTTSWVKAGAASACGTSAWGRCSKGSDICRMNGIIVYYVSLSGSSEREIMSCKIDTFQNIVKFLLLDQRPHYRRIKRPWGQVGRAGCHVSGWAAPNQESGRVPHQGPAWVIPRRT